MTAHCPSCGYNLKAEKPVSVGPMFYDPRGEVRFHGQRVHFSPAERIILGALLAEPAKDVSIEVLMNRLDSEAETNVVNVYLSRIRRKLRAIDPKACPIEARRRFRRWVGAQTT